ncbi:MAG: hypothetical protein OEN01_11365 [Candidatus Krumholzibacteria bacterium]|nr:hypothetical protein [Candidatus Krumholzibacteria bacterium]
MALAKLEIIIGAATLLACAVLSVPSYGQSDSTVTDTLNVDKLAKNPKGFADREIVVTGVVGAVVPKRKIFTIIDQSEYAECKVVTCARYEIPIEFSGKLPDPEQLVMVTGQLVQPQPGRFLFKARRMEIVK